jgi:hypothetical protein
LTPCDADATVSPALSREPPVRGKGSTHLPLHHIALLSA